MKIKLSEIYKIIDEEIQKLNEGYPLEIHVKDKLKVDKILKSLKMKPSKDWTTKFGGRQKFILDIKNDKYYDKVVELLMKKRIKVS